MAVLNLRRWWWGWLLLLAFGQPTRAAAPREHDVKAVFLLNFVRFTEWPINVFPTPQTPLVIGVLGTDDFGPFLDEVVRGELIHGRTVTVQRFQRIEDVQNCQVLFIASGEGSRLRTIFAALQGRNILTVGESDAFTRAGGMIRFYTERGRVKFRINLGVARAAGITLSSKLLRGAEIVGQAQATSHAK